MATVSALTYYPVKGCTGVPVDAAEVTETGLAHDRCFMVTEPDGTFLSQRVITKLAVVRAQVRHGGSKLALAAPGTSDLVVDVIPEGQRRPVSVHRWQGQGIDQGDDAAQWFSGVLGRSVRLFRVPPGHERITPGVVDSKASFADATALLITSRSALDELNARLLERGAEPLPMDRFRPNLVIAGWAEPHTEDRMRRMFAGAVEIGFTKRATRCVVTTVDQSRGERAGPEPLRTLADYRREPDGGVSFGVRAAVLRPGRITVGDEVAVHAWATADESAVPAASRAREQQ